MISRIDYNPSLIWFPPKNSTCTSGKLRTKITSPIAKSTSPRLSDTTFFARWLNFHRFYPWCFCIFCCSNKKASCIPDDVWDAAISGDVSTVNLSKNALSEVPSRWVIFVYETKVQCFHCWKWNNKLAQASCTFGSVLLSFVMYGQHSHMMREKYLKWRDRVVGTPYLKSSFSPLSNHSLYSCLAANDLFLL